MPSDKKHWEFRLRFHLHETVHIACDELELEIVPLGKTERIRLKSWNPGQPIKSGSQASIIAGPFDTKEVAEGAAQRARRALLFWAVGHKTGIDLGPQVQSSHLTDHGLEYFSQLHEKEPLRQDLHGIDVYETGGKMHFLSANVKMNHGKNPEVFAEEFRQHYFEPPVMGEKTSLACELYCASFFDPSPRSRFVTLITAVEALLKPDRRPEPVLKLIKQFEASIPEELDEEEATALKAGLGNLKKESISQTGRSITATLLKGRRFEGKEAAIYFKELYRLRSEIVHTGQPKKEGLNYHDLANACTTFVGELLSAQIAAFSGGQ